MFLQSKHSAKRQALFLHSLWVVHLYEKNFKDQHRHCTLSYKYAILENLPLSHKYTHIYGHRYRYKHVSIQTCLQIQIYVYMYIIYIHISLCVCVCVCVCVCIFIHIYTHIHISLSRQMYIRQLLKDSPQMIQKTHCGQGLGKNHGTDTGTPALNHNGVLLSPPLELRQ